MKDALEKYKEKIKYLSAPDQKEVLKACYFAIKAHQNQKRNSGEPYAKHCIETACFIADLKLDKEAVIAAILHDTIEDTNLALAEIQKNFGKTVAHLVDGVTKLGKIRITRRWFVLKSEKELAFAGIRVTRMNAQFLMQIFGKEANDSLPINMEQVKSNLNKNNIVFCGALRYAVDETSDGTAAKLAHFLKTDFINLTNV
ncbi:MAG: (P)ppGpp synthetase I, SpoT/RelA, partial [Berkelbacteria bacterium GW2011_GWB1_38_5]